MLLKNFFGAKKPQQLPHSRSSSSGSFSQAQQNSQAKREEFPDVPYGSLEYFQRLFKLTDVIDRSRVGLRRTAQVTNPWLGSTSFDISVTEGDIVEIIDQKKSWSLLRNPKFDPGEKDYQGLVPTDCLVEIPYQPRTEIIKLVAQRKTPVKQRTRIPTVTLSRLETLEIQHYADALMHVQTVSKPLPQIPDNFRAEIEAQPAPIQPLQPAQPVPVDAEKPPVRPAVQQPVIPSAVVLEEKPQPPQRQLPMAPERKSSAFGLKPSQPAPSASPVPSSVANVQESVTAKEDLEQIRNTVTALSTRVDSMEKNIFGINNDLKKSLNLTNQNISLFQRQQLEGKTDNEIKLKSLQSSIEDNYETLNNVLQNAIENMRNDAKSVLTKTREDVKVGGTTNDMSGASEQVSLTPTVEKRIAKMEEVIFNQADVIMKLTSTLSELQSFVRDQIARNVHKIEIPNRDLSEERNATLQVRQAIEMPIVPKQEEQAIAPTSNKNIRKSLPSSNIKRDATLDFILQSLQASNQIRTPPTAAETTATPSTIQVAPRRTASFVAPKRQVDVFPVVKKLPTPNAPMVVKEEQARSTIIPAVANEEHTRAPEVTPAIVETLPQEEEKVQPPAIPQIVQHVSRNNQQLEMVGRPTMKAGARKKPKTTLTKLEHLEKQQLDTSLTNVSHETVDAKLPLQQPYEPPSPTPVAIEKEPEPVIARPKKMPIGRGFPVMGVGMGPSAELLAKLKRKD